MNNFSIEIIEEIDNDKLNEREIYWIEKYNSFKCGYNMTIGGYNMDCAIQALEKPVEKRNKDTFELIETYPSLSEAARSLGDNAENKRKNIGQCCAKKVHEVYGYRWNFVGEQPDTIKKG